MYGNRRLFRVSSMRGADQQKDPEMTSLTFYLIVLLSHYSVDFFFISLSLFLCLSVLLFQYKTKEIFII